MEGDNAENRKDKIERVLLKSLRALIRLEVAAQSPALAGKSKGVKRALPTEDPAEPVEEAPTSPKGPTPESIHTDCEVDVITGKACPVPTENRIKSKAQTKHNGTFLNVCKRCKLDLTNEKKRKSAALVEAKPSVTE